MVDVAHFDFDKLRDEQGLIVTTPRTDSLAHALEQALDAVIAAEDAGDLTAAARHRAAAQALVAVLDHRRGHQPHHHQARP